jgi:hypothetical protein
MDIKLAVAWVTLGIIATLAGAILWRVVTGQIDLTRLISEPTGDASMARFQLLVFTIVISLGLFLIIASGTPPGFPDVPGGVLTLLGISSSSYVVSKSIQFSKPEGVEDRPPRVTISPAIVEAKPGDKVNFTAKVERTQNGAVTWSIRPPEVGVIDPNTGGYTAPARVPPSGIIVTVQAVSVASAEGVGTAIVHIVGSVD